MAAGASSLEMASAVEIAHLIATREASPVEVLEAILARHERVNPAINAIVAMDVEAARAEARRAESRVQRYEMRGPLDGVPVTVKDNLFVAGLAATWGSRLYETFMPPSDDIGIGRLRSAGANLFAKTNTPEFALAAHTDSPLFGATRNPWNRDLTPGGSSGGAAAAVAAGLAPLAVGTDAGGSMRRPASYTGVVGFRPSTGRIPRAFGFPALAHDFQVLAPAARTVGDAYLLFRAMAGPDARDRASLCFAHDPLPLVLETQPSPRLRIRYVSAIGTAPIDPEVRDSVGAAARVLSGLGHHVEEGPAPYELEEIERIWATLSSAGLARVAARHPDWKAQVTPGSRAIIERGLTVSTDAYAAALEAMREFRARLAAFFEGVDIVLTPASASLPWPFDEPYPKQIGGRDAGPRGAALFATFVNAGGLPAISVPAGPSPGGVPIGMQLAGRFAADVPLLRLASEFEAAAPWAARRPPIG